MMSNVPRWLDNPLLVKHLRTRLRRPALVQSVIVLAVVLSLVILWDVLRGSWPSPALFQAIGLIQLVILGFLGANQVSSSVGSARASGILDFHRISPEPPRSVMAGFFLGAPIREYLLFALTLPVAIQGVALGQGISGSPSWPDLLQVLAGVLLVSWLLHAVWMLVALTSGRPGQSVSGLQVLLGIGSIFLLSYASTGLPFLTGPGGPTSGSVPVFGQELPWSIALAFYTVPLTVFALIASSRRIRSERAHTLSKSQAVAFVATVAVLVLGLFWTSNTFIVVVYVLLGAGLLGAYPIAPVAGEYARGVRRAMRLGHRHLPFWDDLALCRITLGLICAVVLIGTSVAREVLSDADADRSAPTLTVAVAVLTVASFGLGLQYLRLVAPVNHRSLMWLAIFLLWVVPAVLAGILMVTGQWPSYSRVVTILLGFSPLSSLGAISQSDSELRAYAQIAALIPAVGLPFLLNMLITARHRQIDRGVRTAGERAVYPAAEPALEAPAVF